MGRYIYTVAPFMGAIKSGQSANDVSQQLQALINHYAKHGLEFCEVSEVNIAVAPGCIAGFFGRSTEYTKYDQVISRRPLLPEEERTVDDSLRK